MIKTVNVTPEKLAAFEAQQARIREQMGFADGGPVVCSGLDDFKDVGVAVDATFARAARLSADLHGLEPDSAAGVTTIGVTREMLKIGIDPAVPGTDTTVVDMPPDLAELVVLSALQPATAMLLHFLIAYDGSLAAALSRAIVARAEQIGLQALVSVSPRSMRPKG